MRNIVLFDVEETFRNILPITFTRPISYIRVGIVTIKEKWEAMLPGNYSVKTVDFLSDVFPCRIKEDNDTLYIDSSVLPSEELVEAIGSLEEGEKLCSGDTLIAYVGQSASGSTLKEFKGELHRIEYVFSIFLENGKEILKDYRRLTAGRKSCPLPSNNLVIGSYEDEDGNPMIFLEEGAEVEGATLNLKEGPIYIGRNARIMEGSCVRGPLALCENAQIRLGAKVYGATTLGPFCKGGGEMSNVVMLGYSNKSHDGYLGNAVIGEWCNIGAGVNASNLKNDYSKIRIWNYVQQRFMKTDLQFCGLIMGDHSKAGVNCMFNTATVLGVGVNVHGAGFPRVFVPSFSEGSASAGFSDVSLKKFFDIAVRVMGRRDKDISEEERRMYEHVYHISQHHK